MVDMGEDGPEDEQSGERLQRSADEMETGPRVGLEEARRRVRVPLPPSGSLEARGRGAYEVSIVAAG